MTATRAIYVETPEERERLERLAALIEAEKPDIIRRFYLADAAAKMPGFADDCGGRSMPVGCVWNGWRNSPDSESSISATSSKGRVN